MSRAASTPVDPSSAGPQAALPDVVLHQWEISPFCAKVRKILRLKGIAYRVENYNGLRALKASKLTHAGKLPVLDWGSERVVDSTAIAAFLEQRRPAPPLYPANPREAALARMYEDWAGASLYHYGVYFRVEYAQARAQAIALMCEGRPAWERAIFGPAFTRQLRRKVDTLGFTRRDGPEIEAAFLHLMDDLDTTLRASEWLAGSAQSIADIAVSAMLDEMLRTSTLADRIRSRPNLAKWLARQQGP
jgi:glutathione S-transferase